MASSLISTLFLVILLHLAHQGQTSDPAKRHHDKEMNTIKVPSSLCGGVSRSLGMESDEISDWQITASSSYNQQSVGPTHARLNREQNGGAWCPVTLVSADTSGQEWIQVDLQGLFVVTAIATQGRFGNGMGVEFTEEYWIEYSRDNGTTWNKWTDMNGDYKLPGNHDTYTPQKNILSHPLVGVQLIRIVPSSNYQRMTCLRFELYGCSHDHTLPVAYAMQDGVKESSLGDLRDLTYDGRHDFYDYLTGGIGQLVDGNRGDDNYKVNYGYEWIGWRSEGDRELSIIFRFATVVNFTSVTFYAHNLLSKDIQVFSEAKISFSFDGLQWSRRPIGFAYMPDLVLEHARDVSIHLYNCVGQFIKFELSFANKWILLSEVTFNTSLVGENVTLSLEDLDLRGYYEQFEPPYSTVLQSDSGLIPQTTFLIVFGVLFTVICLAVLFLLRMHLRRKEKAGHIVVCMKDLATTPLYCEPKDFSSTSSTISNTVVDPEYAVPDVTMSNAMPHPGARPGPAGHLSGNLNMFGAGFTRIFMGGAHLKNGVDKSKTLTAGQHVANNGNLGSVANISTPNVAYSTQKFQYHNEGMTKGGSYNVNKAASQNGVHKLANGFGQRVYYPSGDLMPPKSSPKMAPASQQSVNTIDHAVPAPAAPKMTSNTIYNKRKQQYGTTMANDEMMSTNAATLKMKYSQGGQPELIEDMKCIPEVAESEIEVIHQPFGYSRYGQVMLGKFRDSGPGRIVRPRYANDGAPETETANCEVAPDKAHGGAATNESARMVVLKTLESEKLRADFLHEMKSKWFISAKSERVAKLIGYLNTGRHTAMVVECGDCDLNHFLRNCDKKAIGMQALLHIGSEVAMGMKYLESLGYVHRDLSTRNCLIYTGSLRVKITDIAGSVTANQSEYCNGVALRWAAPEALINGQFSTKSDVYSFGVTLWEILTYGLVRPHHELDDEAFLQKIFSAYESYVNNLSNECSSNSIYYQATYNGSIGGTSVGGPGEVGSGEEVGKPGGNTRLSYRLALPRPTTCPAEIYDLMLECWQLNEHIRPSFRDITQFLTTRHVAGQDQIYA